MTSAPPWQEQHSPTSNTLHPEAHQYLLNLLYNHKHILTITNNTGNWLLVCTGECQNQNLTPQHCEELENHRFIHANNHVSVPTLFTGDEATPFDLTKDALDYLSTFVPLAQAFLQREANPRSTYTTEDLFILNKLGHLHAQTNNRDLVDTFALTLTPGGALHQHKNGRWRFIYEDGVIPSAPIRSYIARALITAGLYERNDQLDHLHAHHGYTSSYSLSRPGVDLARDLYFDVFDPYDARLNIHDYLQWELEDNYCWIEQIPKFKNASPEFDSLDPESLLYWLTVHTTYYPNAIKRDPGLKELIQKCRNEVIQDSDEHVANGLQTSAHANTLQYLKH